MAELRAAAEADIHFLRRLSSRLSSARLEAQIREGRLRIIEDNDEPIGFLKFCILWETLPFIEVLVVCESYRGRGHGTQAVRAWESEMAIQGFSLVLTSTQSDQTAQHFWRKLGYRDCGALTESDKPAEIFMQRQVCAKNHA